MSSERHDEVMEFVESLMAEEDDDLTVSEMQERAAEEVDASVAEMSLRAFNASFPLQVRRRRYAKAKEKVAEARERATEAATGTGTNSKRPKLAEAERAMRQALLAFARDVRSAETDADLIGLVGEEVQVYVDEVMEVVGEAVIEGQVT
jgi:hypothetical protein